MIFHVKRNTIFKRLFIPVMGILLIQAILYTAVILSVGIGNQVKRNTFDIFNERVINRKLYVESEMVQRWSNITEGEMKILGRVAQTLDENGATYEDIRTNAVLNEKIIQNLAEDLIFMLRKNSVTGAFVVLDGIAIQGDSGSKTYAGLYIRDLDPTSYTNDRSDLLIERGLPSVTKSLNISLDSYWNACFRFPNEGEAENEKFFFEPLNAARSGNSKKGTDYGYWSPSFSLSSKDIEVITYSIPLIAQDGTVFGVMGIDITHNYLLSLLKYDEIDFSKNGAYVLGIIKDNTGSIQCIWSKGPMYKANFGHTELIHGEKSKYENIYKFNAPKNKGREVYGSVQPLQLYNVNSPFESQKWVLVGMLEKDDLLKFSNYIREIIFLSTVVSLIIGFLGVFVSSGVITRPIKRLVTQLRRSDPNKPIVLEKINIEEIDVLTVSIEDLSKAVHESASKISKIFEMTQIPVGVFEYSKNSERVFCSKNWFELTKSERASQKDDFIPKEDFDNQMQYLSQFIEDPEQRIYRIPCGENDYCWLKFTYILEDNRALGAVMDITKEMKQKQQIEYERDYDVLTDLFNRRAFEQQVQELFKEEDRLKTAAMIMWDLDNLKYINDMFGHNLGDQYICELSERLKAFNHSKGIVSRRSGDEFLVFLYGYDSKKEIMDEINFVWNSIQKAKLQLPNGESMRIRVSAGIAWYPQDSRKYDELIRYSDFAMYTIKHTSKGDIQEFNKNIYQSNSVLVNGTEALNQMIENRLVQYELQPIIEVSTCRIYGYEMLMRSQLETLKNPLDIIRLARSQSKLYQIEKLTFFQGMETFKKLVEEGKIPFGTKVFINSIGSQILTDSDLEEFREKYADYLKFLVIELTETDPLDSQHTKTKIEIARSNNSMIAIDDFGSGYNCESSLIFFSPDFIKVDMAIVKNIDKDANCRNILENIIQYAKKRNIKVLAEGVETKEEMETLVQCGVDYLQGYYFGRPSYEIQPIDPSSLGDMNKIYSKLRKENKMSEISYEN